MTLSLKLVQIGLSVVLVLVTAAIVGGSFSAAADKAVQSTKDTGQAGLASAFQSGTHDVEGVSTRLLSKMVDELSALLLSYMSTPVEITTTLVKFLSQIPADTSGDPKFLRDVMQPQVAALERMGVMKGVASVMLIVLPLPPRALTEGGLGTEWGGTVGQFVQYSPVPHPSPDENGLHFTSIESRLEKHDGNKTYWVLGTNNSHVWNGDSDDAGRIRNWAYAAPEHCDVPLRKPNGYHPDCIYSVVANVPTVEKVKDRMILGGMDGKDGSMFQAPNRAHWSPFHTVSTRLMAMSYGAFAHPDWHLVQAMMGTPDPRGGFVMCTVESSMLSSYMKDIARGVNIVGTRVYGAERDPWSKEVVALAGASAGDAQVHKDNDPEEKKALDYEAHPRPVGVSVSGFCESITVCDIRSKPDYDGIGGQRDFDECRRCSPRYNNAVLRRHGEHALGLERGFDTIAEHSQMTEWPSAFTFPGADAASELEHWEDYLAHGSKTHEWDRGTADYRIATDAEQAVILSTVEKEVEFWRGVGNNDVLYWCRTKVVTDNKGDYQSGFLWYITMMIPRDAMMKEIDAARARVQKQSDKDYEDTDKERTTSLIVTVIVVVIASMVMIAGSIAVTLLTIRPLHVLESEMAKVATMDLDSVRDRTRRSDFSGLLEVRKMQKSFHRMLRNLKEFRNFMPASVLCSHDAADAEAEEAQDETGTMMSGSQRSQSHKSKSRASQASSRHGGGGMASSAASSMKSAAMKKFLHKQMGDGIKRKKISWVVTNVANWHVHTKSLDDNTIVALHSRMIEGCMAAGRATKAITDSFSGDRVLFSLNAVQPLGSHRVAAGHTLVSVREFFKFELIQHSTTTSSRIGGPTTASGAQPKSPGVTGSGNVTASQMKGPVNASIQSGIQCTGCALSGEAKIGNMGCAGMKRFSFLSPMLTFTYALERLCRSLGASGVTDSSFAAEVSGQFNFRTIDKVTFPKVPAKKKDDTDGFMIRELCGKKSASEDEWMYQLEEGEAADPNKEWNNAINEANSGNMDPLKAVLTTSYADGLTREIMLRFKAVSDAGKFDARPLLYH